MNIIKKTTLLAFILILTGAYSTNLKAQDTNSGKTGLGIMLGEPSGITLKNWFNSKNSVDVGVAWSLAGNDALYLHADYQWHSPLDVEKGNLAFFYGVGGRVILDNETFVGARIPLGLSYLAPEAPLEFFIEVAPVLNLTPNTDGDADGGIGVRYYF